MSELDTTKERIAYLRFWLVIMAGTDLGLLGWLIFGSAQASRFLVVAGCISVFLVSMGLFLLHGSIERRIEDLREL